MTNDVENSHKQIVTTFGGWHIGVETSCTLMRERRHRLNDRMSQKYRFGYIYIGHVNTWLVDILQLLVEDNHGVMLFPYWVNASDYKDTDESFDLVALHSTDLHEAVNSIAVNPDVLRKLTSELKFIAKGMGVQLPFLPVHGKEEMQLFVQLILNAPGGFDADEMALRWCDYVDGVSVFPKLPVYLREYHGVYLKNGRVKDAVKVMKNHVELLEAINKELVPRDLANDGSEDCAVDGSEMEDAVETEDTVVLTGWPEVPLPSAMPRPERIAQRPVDIGPPTVGGTLIGLITDAPDAPPFRKSGRRGKDSKPRAPRRCKRCNAATCRGAKPGTKGGALACQNIR
jgi:hypothetical protein